MGDVLKRQHPFTSHAPCVSDQCHHSVMVDEADSPSSTNSSRWREKEPEGSQPPRHVRCRMNRGEVRKDLIGETAAVVAAQRGAGMALGHAALSYARTGERAP